MTKLTQDTQDALEAYIDEFGLSAVVDAIADICGAKADHLRTNWQDEQSARIWDQDGRKIAGTAGEVRS